MNNVAIDVAIGLMFVFLLYSLLATVVSEIIATLIGLRARNLKEAVNRMLNDEEERGFFKRLFDSINIFKNPRNPVINNFYNHPEIKYLGSSGIFRNPSAFKAISFSKTLLQVLYGNEPFDAKAMDVRLKELLALSKKNEKVLDPDTAQYIYSLWAECYGDIVKFKFQLEMWFDRTMEQATEWYKRKIQVILLILGFFMAWVFNADTLAIVDTLSNDKDARRQMVEMASIYLKENQGLIDSIQSAKGQSAQHYRQRLDSLLEIKKDLDEDIARANTLLGLGSWPSDTIRILIDKKTGKKSYQPTIDIEAVPDTVLKRTFRNEHYATGGLPFWTGAKRKYFFNLFGLHFFGYLLTAFAVSLGAPFWFDLLNKLMKLRTSAKIESSSPNTTTVQNKVLLTDREA